MIFLKFTSTSKTSECNTVYGQQSTVSRLRMWHRTHVDKSHFEPPFTTLFNSSPQWCGTQNSTAV